MKFVYILCHPDGLPFQAYEFPNDAIYDLNAMLNSYGVNYLFRWDYWDAGERGDLEFQDENGTWKNWDEYCDNLPYIRAVKFIK